MQIKARLRAHVNIVTKTTDEQGFGVRPALNDCVASAV